MSRKFFQISLIALLLLLLSVSPTKADSITELVGVRIPVEENGEKLNTIAIESEMVIDYGSYLWTVISVKDLSNLERAGVTYQQVEDPFVLTLGGQSFDPLFSEPAFTMNWETKSSDDGAGLHLVQFYGPIKSEWVDALEEDGLSVIQYIYPYTYVVWGDAGALSLSAEDRYIRWTGDYLPAYAVQSANRSLSNNPILLRATLIPQAGLEETLMSIEALGGIIVGSSSGVDPAFDLASFILSGDQIQAAAALPGVYTISPVPTDGGDRGEMSNQINVGNYTSDNTVVKGYLDWLAEVGLSGEGVVVAVVDSGTDQTHPDLVNRMVETCTGDSCGNGTSNDHGTHTAGIIAGDASSGITDAFGFLRGLGMAPSANLVEQVYYLIESDPDRMLTLMTESYRNGAVISSNSWGPSATPQGYDEDTRLVDIGVRDADPVAAGNQPLTFVLAIMNGWGEPSSQGSPDEAKNAFTIGSTYAWDKDTGTPSPNIFDLSENTGYGPALDGRTIPHLVAPGYLVDSTLPNDSYGLIGGTSMAAPQVSGAVALFYEYYRGLYGVDPSPALVKAAFLAAAIDLSGNLGANGEELEHPFDSKQGWGRMDADAVLDPGMGVYYFDQEFIFTETGQTWTTELTTTLPVRYLKVMLVWTDAPGTPDQLDTPAWVNDLDLTVSDGTNTYYGNNFGADGLSVTGGTADGMNNTEGVFLPPSSAGTITITVTAATIAGNGVPNNEDGFDQDFALVYYYPLVRTIFPIFYR